MAGALAGIHAGVIGQGLDSVHVEHFGHLLHLLAAEAVDDAALAGVLLDESDDLALHILLGPDLVVEVGPVEGGLEDPRIGDVEVLEDVLLHLLGGGGGEGDDRHALDVVEDRAQAAVLGAEVVAPLADAVSLVDGEEADLDVPQELGVLLLGEALGRHVEDLRAPFRDVLAHTERLVAGEGAVEEMGDALLLAEAAQRVHLVLHERDERAHHDGGAIHHERGQLVAQALAATRGHDDEGVAPVEDALDDGLLFPLELLEAEELLERLLGRQVNIDHRWNRRCYGLLVECLKVRRATHSCRRMLPTFVKRDFRRSGVDKWSRPGAGAPDGRRLSLAGAHRRPVPDDWHGPEVK